jgi:hypothetical protein
MPDSMPAGALGDPAKGPFIFYKGLVGNLPTDRRYLSKQVADQASLYGELGCQPSRCFCPLTLL